MTVLFLVNGASSSAAAERARRFAAGLAGAHIMYRTIPKWRAMLAFIWAGLRIQPDLVYVMDTAYAGVLAGALSRMLIGSALVVDTGDVAYELARSTGNYNCLELGLIRAVEYIGVRAAHAVVVRGSFHRELLIGEGIERVEFIPDGVEIESGEWLVDPLRIPVRFGLGNELVVGMVGSMIWSRKYQMCYGWDILEAMVHLRDLPVKVCLVGDGDGRSQLERRAKQIGVADRVEFVGRVEPSDLPKKLAGIHVCVSTQSNDTVGWVRTTGKLPIYLAAGRYVVATDVGQAHYILSGAGCLLPYTGVRDDSHPRRLAEQIRAIVEDPELLKTAASGRALAQIHFDYAQLADRVIELCKDLIRR